VPGLSLAAQTVDVAAGASIPVVWTVDVPAGRIDAALPALEWQVAARETGGAQAADTLKITQRVLPAVPVTVQQAALVQVDGSFSLPVAPPAGALATAGTPRGGVAVALQATLADGLPGVRRWFERYPYSCLEQQSSRAIGLADAARWQAVVASMPSYLDEDGLANYFPVGSDARNTGNPVLTAYLLRASSQAAKLDNAYALPADLARRMTQGLAAFVDGRITRDTWAPRSDLALRKLAAIDALANVGAARASMLDSIEFAPNQWPVSSLIDYLDIVARVNGIAQADDKRAQAEQVLRGRLVYEGTQLTFSSAANDDVWWLMEGPQSNAARLVLTFAGNPGWKDDMPRLMTGLLAMQRGGAWQTTTANMWGTLAVRRFAQEFESGPVTGTTAIRLGDVQRSVDWAGAAPAQARSQTLPWAPSPQSLLLTHTGSGRPWATVQGLAAVPLTQPQAAGYRIAKTLTPVNPAVSGTYTRGDLVRVRLEVQAQADMGWVVINDPIPAGASIMGSGLGRDSQAATSGEKSDASPIFVERDFDGYRAYYDYLPHGKWTVEYTMRLNSSGTFNLPPTRVEAMYSPSAFGALPNAALTVQPEAGTPR
jgi:hypothetical protein